MKGVVALVLALAALSTPAQAGEFIEADRPVPGRYLVVFRAEAVRTIHAQATDPGRTVAQLMSEMALTYDGVTTRHFEHALRGGVIATTEARARAIARDPRVAWVEEDGEIQAFTTEVAYFAWWADRIDERDRPLNNHFTYTTNGAGVNVYVVDTGVDFGLGHWPGRGYNSYSNVRDAAGNMVFGDPVGHGSNVAVHAASIGNGIARGANVRAVRVRTISCSVGGGGNGEVPAFQGTCFTLADLVDALNWVAGNRIKPAVANLSFGGAVSATLETAVRGVVNAGVATVAAAGNGNTSACNVSPARMPEVITVGATTQSDARASFSNFGSCVTLFAPGEGVYFGESGTSFSAPIVAGVAAKYLQSAPSATPSSVKTHLINNATTGRLTNIGAGSPNRLVFAPPGGTEVDNLPTANFNFSCSGRTCTFTSTSTDDFGIVYCVWYWDHPYDWQPREGCTLSHTFPAAGSYNVTLTVYDDAWRQASKLRLVTVN
jgi:hypothetical protein